MKTNILNIRILFLSCLVMALGITMGGCSDDEEELQPGYGYAQFKLFKSGTYQKDGATRAGTNELDYLREAQKMKIVLVNQDDGTEVIQTIGLSAMGEDSEFGLRSEKLQLMTGHYQVVGFYLYKVVYSEEAEDYVLESILSGEPEESTVLTIVDGGLAVQDIAVKVVERGSVKFTLTKNFVSTRSGLGDDYVFSDIYYVNITVENQFSKQTTPFENIPVKYEEKFGENGKEVSVAVSDSLLYLAAGTYKVISYTTKKKQNKSALEYGEIEGSEFKIEDNKTTDVDVPLTFYESTASIKDYLILKEIWEALKGPKTETQKGWSYSGTTYPIGSNWNFNKDIDLWGDQPGVDLDSKGRVVSLAIGAFAPIGDIPESLGELTELRTLSLGNHSDLVGDNIIEKTMGAELTENQWNTLRDDYYNKFVKSNIAIANDFSEPLQQALTWQKEGKPKVPPMLSANSLATHSKVSPKDVPANRLTNEIRKIPKTIGNLVNLQLLYIANGKFVDFEEGTDFSQLTKLTDVELYNCPSMSKLPKALKTLPSLQLLNLANNPNLGDFHEDLGEFVASDKIKASLQILYLSFNKLTILPDMSMVEKLGKLDCIHNQIKTITKAFGSKVNLVQLTMDYNQITEIPRADDGSFCGYADVETFSFSNNKLTKFPDIFSSESIYVMSSVNFSGNEIDGFEDGFKGVNVATLSLGGNRLKEFPKVLFTTNSQIGALVLSGNGLEEFPEGIIKSSTKSHLLKTLDLTYNKLSKLPKDFNGIYMPFLYGVDLSNNRFSECPTGPMDAATLTVFGLRNQRDVAGNRTLRQWPTGIYRCPSLSALYMGGNDLRKVDDTISPNIYIFEIKDNPNISINLSAVCSYIQYGYYRLIYDKTQDIRGCDYLKD